VAEPKQHISTERARSASSEHVVRYVLGASFLLAIIAMVTILLVWWYIHGGAGLAAETARRRRAIL